MTQTLGLNGNNDIYIGADGNLVVLYGINAVQGACETISKSQLGEMVLTTTQGIPNFQTIWVGVPNYPLWQSYLTQSLLNVVNVTGISDFSFSTQNDILSYTATIQTSYGITQITG